MTLAALNILPVALCLGAVGIVFYAWALAKVAGDADREMAEALERRDENWVWPEE